VFLIELCTLILVFCTRCSKTCSSCGTIKSSLPLNVREWACDACGTTHDRDINATKNLMALGTSVTAFGGDVRPTCRQTPAKKESATSSVSR